MLPAPAGGLRARLRPPTPMPPPAAATVCAAPVPGWPWSQVVVSHGVCGTSAGLAVESSSQVVVATMGALQGGRTRPLTQRPHLLLLRYTISLRRAIVSSTLCLRNSGASPAPRPRRFPGGQVFAHRPGRVRARRAPRVGRQADPDGGSPDQPELARAQRGGHGEGASGSPSASHR